jgi:hypothetical protein
MLWPRTLRMLRIAPGDDKARCRWPENLRNAFLPAGLGRKSYHGRCRWEEEKRPQRVFKSGLSFIG